MSSWPWKHIVTTLVAFVGAYGLTQIAQGYDTVAVHWSWQAVIQGLIASGLYNGGLVQQSPMGVKP